MKYFCNFAVEKEEHGPMLSVNIVRLLQQRRFQGNRYDLRKLF